MNNSNSKLYTLCACLILVIFSTGCVDDDDNSGANEIERLSSNYSLSLEGLISAYSDEAIEYDFCTDISTRNIQTNKYYDGSTVIYEVILDPLNIVNQPKVFSYAFYVYWDQSEAPDVSFFDAVTEITQGNSLRKYHLQFVVRNEQNISFSNSFFYTNRTTNTDSSSDQNLRIIIPDNFECRIYGERLGELNYQYSGFIYSSERVDSMLVDYFDLQLFVPLSL
jgi:hypothetical protein